MTRTLSDLLREARAEVPEVGPAEAQSLAARGARLDVKDKEGRTALRWAEGVFLAAVGAERKPETIALLEELVAQSKKSAAGPRN